MSRDCLRITVLALLIGCTAGPIARGQPPEPKGRPIGLGDPPDRIEAEYKRLASDPGYDVARLRIAATNYIDILSALGKHDLAIGICEELYAQERTRSEVDERDGYLRLGQLVQVYHRAGRHDRAIAHLEKYAEWCQVQYGEKSLNTIEIRLRIGDALFMAGRKDQAIKLYQDLVALYPGASDQRLELLNALRMACWRAGRKDLELATCELLLETARVRAKSAEPSAPVSRYVFEGRQWPSMPISLASARRSLVVLYFTNDKKEKANKLIEAELEKARSASGTDQPDALGELTSIAELYFDVQQPEKALAVLTEVVEVQKRKDENSQDTFAAMNRLASGYQRAGKSEDAVKLYRSIFEKMKGRFGEQDGNTVGARMILATAQLSLAIEYEQNNKSAAAEPLLRECLEHRKAVFKSALHPDTLLAQAWLGNNLLKQQKWVEAEGVLRECLAGRRKLEPQNWTTFNTLSLLGGALLGQKKYQEAEPLLMEGYEGMKKRESFIPKQAQMRLTDAVDRLVKLYDATDRKEKADEFRKLLPAKDKK